jgi:RNA-directed DNA polymerase
MTVRQLPKYLKRHWSKVRGQLLAGTYRPPPVKRVEIPKPDGGVRKRGISTALDRIIQQAVLQILPERWDRTFSEQNYGFHPERSAHQAVAQVQAYIAEGYGYPVDMDLEKFFDRVHHDMLMGRIAKRVEDKRMLKLIRAFLYAGIMERGLVSPSAEGTRQGGPLVPLLSNLLLDDLDKELERRGRRFVRHADDCNIYVRSRRAGERVMHSITRFITDQFRLQVNASKSAVARPAERKFLRFKLTSGRPPTRRIAPKSLWRFKERIRELTKRNRGVSLVQMVADLCRYLTGWRNYFGFCQTPSMFPILDSWLRRRLRCFQWKHGESRRTHFAEFRPRGVGKDLAAQTAGSSRELWHVSRSLALSIALPGAYFDALGLPRLSETSRFTHRTAVVRTRMPGGVTGIAREGRPMSIRTRSVRLAALGRVSP